MFSGFLFSLVRIFELLTLIPIWGLLAYFVDLAQPATPGDNILFLFVVAILATVWAVITLYMYHRMRWTPLYIAVVDLCFFGVLIGGVVLLGRIVRHSNCVSWYGEGIGYNADGRGYVTAGELSTDKQCLMLKSAWGLGIVDIILFFSTAVLAAHVWHHTGIVVYEERPRRRRAGRW